MKEGKGRGKEREAPTHLIENSKVTHAAFSSIPSLRAPDSVHTNNNIYCR